jgi:hypothetical protein
MTRTLVILCLLAGCTESTELLDQRKDATAGDGSPRTKRDFCPTRIDVYGGINMQLAGCGGAAPTDATLGYFSPGAPGYDSTVAGRLLARVTDDPDLVPIFGPTWTVRSCAGSGQTLSQLTSPLSEDDCGVDGLAEGGSWQTSCADDPAPVLLFAAGMLDDRCHGGGPDSSAQDDPATYVRHYAQRMEAFLASRNPRLALVGPLTEWTQAPPYTDNTQAACEWQRPQWDEQGVQGWAESMPGAQGDARDIEVVPDLHAEFRAHGKCCQILDGSCSTNWFGHDSQEVASCDGAQAIVDFWYARLKSALLARDSTCP